MDDPVLRGTLDVVESPELTTKARFYSTVAKWNHEKLANYGLIALLLYAALAGIIRAASKPFWFDELCTLAVAQQHTVSAMLDALRHAVDSHPPPFYLVERVAGTLVANEHIAYRLPSIFALCCVVLCIFAFVKRHSRATVALFCAAVPLVSILSDYYAVEARGYMLETAAVALAMVCYQRADSLIWTLGMGFSLAAATMSHYYAAFVLFSFAAAEFAFSWKAGRLRWRVWGAFACGVVPVLVFWPLLESLRHYYQGPYFIKPTLGFAVRSYGSIFEVSDALGFGIAVIAGILLVADMRPGLPRRSASEREEDLSFHLRVLALGLLCLPFVMFVGMKIIHGGILPRYLLPTALGFAVALGCGLARVTPRVLVLCGVLLLATLGMQDAWFLNAHRDDLGSVASPAAPVEDLVRAAHHPDLPIAIAHGHEYFQFVHYASQDWARRAVYLADPPSALSYAGSEAVDQNLMALQQYMPFQVYQFHEFAVEHPEFLLYADGATNWVWWPARLLEEKYTLQLAAIGGDRRVYLVTKATDALRK